MSDARAMADAPAITAMTDAPAATTAAAVDAAAPDTAAPMAAGEGDDGVGVGEVVEDVADDDVTGNGVDEEDSRTQVLAKGETAVEDAVEDAMDEAEDGAMVDIDDKPEGVDELQAQIMRGKTKYSFNRKGDSNNLWHVGFNVDSQEEAEKRAKRAQRFGEKNLRVQQQERQERFGLVQPPKIPSGQVPRADGTPESEVRLDAVHLYGTDGMSTRDLMNLFMDYLPSHIEWINDSSCNIVWGDVTSAQNALWALGKPVDMGGTDKNIAPELRWRLLVSTGVTLIMRAGTTSDVKKKNAAQESKYYQKLFAQKGIHRKQLGRNMKSLPKRKKPMLTSKSRRMKKEEGISSETVAAIVDAKMQEARKMAANNKNLKDRLGRPLAPSVKPFETGERFKPEVNPLKEEPVLAMDMITPSTSFGPVAGGTSSGFDENWYQSEDEDVMDDGEQTDSKLYSESGSGYMAPSW